METDYARLESIHPWTGKYLPWKVYIRGLANFYIDDSAGGRTCTQLS